MSKFIQLALDNKDITVFGDGSQTRTFCYIDDNLDACISAMNSEIAKNDTFNIGNDTIVTILELAQTIIELTGSSSKIVHLPPLPEGDMTRRQPDISKMKTLLNRELTPFREGIQRILVEKYGF
jgi:UDP-glucose 4-epimerase